MAGPAPRIVRISFSTPAAVCLMLHSGTASTSPQPLATVAGRSRSTLPRKRKSPACVSPQLARRRRKPGLSGWAEKLADKRRVGYYPIVHRVQLAPQPLMAEGLARVFPGAPVGGCGRHRAVPGGSGWSGLEGPGTGLIPWRRKGLGAVLVPGGSGFRQLSGVSEYFCFVRDCTTFLKNRIHTFNPEQPHITPFTLWSYTRSGLPSNPEPPGTTREQPGTDNRIRFEVPLCNDWAISRPPLLHNGHVT